MPPAFVRIQLFKFRRYRTPDELLGKGSSGWRRRTGWHTDNQQPPEYQTLS